MMTSKSPQEITQLLLAWPRVLFEGNFLINYDVAADGQRFLMVKNEQGSMRNYTSS